MPPRMGLLLFFGGLATTMSLLTELGHGTLKLTRSPTGRVEFGPTPARLRFRDELILKILIFRCLQQNIRCGWPKIKTAPLKIHAGVLKIKAGGLNFKGAQS